MTNPNHNKWRDRALTVLSGKVPGLVNCPTCGPDGVGKVAAMEHVVTPLVYDPDGNAVLVGTTYPHLMLTCGNCGFTRFFNQVALVPESGVPINVPK